MNDFFAKNKIVILIGVVLMAFVGYYFYHRGSVPSDTALVSSTQGDVSQSGTELIALIADLDSIKLDKAIFDDATFKTFIDFSQPIPSQPKGGRNPFSPPVFAAPGVVIVPTAGKVLTPIE